MAQLVFPFALGFVLVLVQPVIDMACEDTLERNRFDNRAIEAARWSGATSAFLPAAALTSYGALLVMWDEGHEEGDWILIGALILLVGSFVLFLYGVSRGGPAQSRRIGLREFKYTVLQVFLAVLNAVGIALVVWYRA